MPYPALHPASAAGNRYRILVIDDSPDDLRLLVQLLKERGYRLSIARDGSDGYQRAAIDPPDLILLDVFMPRVDGFAACRLLKADARTRSIPVIFLTAANDVEARLKGFSLGAVDYICKPFVADEVLARVGIHVDLAERLHRTVAPQSPGTARAALPHAAPDPDTVLVEAAKNLLAEYLSNPPPMAGLVRQLGTNERRLNELFRRHTNMTVFTWLREERLRQGRRLLTETRMDIAAIAEQLGYHSQSHFSNAFRERCGASPREFRALKDG